jgi:hypothetical protein
MMEVPSIPETFVNLHQTKRCYNKADGHLHSRRRENLKSFLVNRCVEDTVRSVFKSQRSDN